MTRDPVTISKNASLLECAGKMIKKKVGSLLIIEKKKLIGIISERDILWALVKKSKKDLEKIKAIEISPKKMVTLKSSSTIEEIVDKIKKYKFYRYPVLKDGEVVGIITIKDILNFYPELHREFKELQIIREERKKLKRLKKAGVKSRKKGFCEECGNEDYLYKVNGMLICSSCSDSM